MAEAKYPTITFKSTRVEKGADGKLLATGNLTLHGVTKPVTLTVDSITAPSKAPWGATVRGASATGKLSRKDFGLVWNKTLETGGVAVGDEVQLTIDAELVEQPKQTAGNQGPGSTDAAGLSGPSMSRRPARREARDRRSRGARSRGG